MTADELNTITTPKMTKASVTRNSVQSGFSLRATFSPQLQSRQTEQCKNEGRNPKSDDHLGFLPAQHLEVMMKRRHKEDAFPSQLERDHLNHHRQAFNHKHAAHKRQQKLLFDQNRNDADRAAQRQRTYIAHEDFRGMGVVPE